MNLENSTDSANSSNYLSPKKVVRDALSRITSTGEVMLLDSETGEQFMWPPHESHKLEKLPRDVYIRNLLTVARIIYGTVFQVRSFPGMKESCIQNLAIVLSPYRNNDEFLEKVTSLVRLDENGFLLDPTLPMDTANFL